MSSLPRMPEAAGVAPGFVEDFDFLQPDLVNLLDHHLSDAITALKPVGFWAQID